MKNIEILKNCQICNALMNKVLDLGNHPLCDDLLEINSNYKNKEYPILILCKFSLASYIER